jgi:glycogen phosphorylase
LKPSVSAELHNLSNLLQQYGCGPVRFEGADNALYERHLLFDSVIDMEAATPRDRFEAFARSVRDILSQRWVLTEKTYERENPKRLYYLSMEFLIGRSLANNVTNLLLGEAAQDAIYHKNLDWIDLLEQEPDAALGNGGLGRLAACFMESAATLHLPAMGYGLRYDYGLFKQVIRDGWQCEEPDHWLRRQDPWEVVRLNESVEVRLNCSFEISGGSLRALPGQSSSLIGIPFDRPIVGYGGTTINTLRLWAAAAPDFFNFQAGPLSRRHHKRGSRASLRTGIFLGCVLAGRSSASLPAQQRRLERILSEGRPPA